MNYEKVAFTSTPFTVFFTQLSCKKYTCREGDRLNGKTLFLKGTWKADVVHESVQYINYVGDLAFSYDTIEIKKSVKLEFKKKGQVILIIDGEEVNRVCTEHNKILVFKSLYSDKRLGVRIRSDHQYL